MKRFLQITPADNVAVILIDDDPVAPCGHKIALKTIAKGNPVIKYGYPIGTATTDIAKGEWVHSHNLTTGLGDDLEYTYQPQLKEVEKTAGEVPTINSYLRADGSIGIRNELWVIPTVGCVNGQANAIVQHIKKECDLAGIDDVCAFTHNYGCSQLGTDHANTRSALAALAKHPNAGGVLILGLGCENNRIAGIQEQLGDFNPERIRFLNAQDVEDDINTGIEICKQLLAIMHNDHRSPQPISKLKIGLKCGGSDGFSGITANPLLGRLSDRLTTWGATTVLTEVPEMFGAETILMNRAANRNVFNRIVHLINDFKAYFRSYGQPIYENPSPGNKDGGITTLEEKSLGCIQKGGTSTIQDVLPYASPLRIPGLNLLNAPGNDLVASTALALSGCHLVLFTTGRGTPFGTFVPTVKVSTNNRISQHKHHWIDFNAGVLLDEKITMDCTTDDLLSLVIATANGKRTRNESIGAKEFAIFKNGVTL